MKQMKKLLASALILLLVMMSAVPAMAENEAQYATTQDFIRALEENELKYSYVGIDDDGDEKVTVSYGAEPYEEYKFRFYFNEDQTAVFIRMWNIVTVSAGETYALKTINALNAGYKYVKFYLDESDSTLSLSADFPLTGNNSGDAVLYMMNRLNGIMTHESVETAILSLK